MFLAAVLALGINAEIDLSALHRYYEQQAPAVTCGIRVVGYHIAGRPGQQFGYGVRTFTIPPEGFIEVIFRPRVKHYTFEGRKLPLENGGPLDPFSFRWITLPASQIEGGNHE